MAAPLIDGEDYSVLRVDGVALRRIANGVSTGVGAALTIGGAPGAEFRWVTSFGY